MTVAAALLLAVVLGMSLSAQSTTPSPQPLLIPSTYGGDLFRHYCAPCHGVDGRGYGPTAEALRQRPPDLTTIARRNGGTFPTSRLFWLIGGKDGEAFPPSHGSREMPVWGPIFGALDAHPKAAEIRVANLITYVESIQGK